MLGQPAPAGRLLLNNFSFEPTRIQAALVSGPVCAVGDPGTVTEFVLPSNCPTGVAPADCALIVTPPAGQEVFTLIFSRDLITDLPNTPAEAGGGGIPPAILIRLRNESGQVLKRGRGTTPFSVVVVNTNTRDNEDLYETLLLNKGQ